ncbi:helix-turn-helix transcriptional regulator [Haloarcula marina]|uniref:helix-turn-helix transcriptional regulator n=1 Tax=Haloarcula marina TaxID=2961574 RepID=UPI0020B8A9FA|nr:transcriptional regulator FilR1 domain-containing protein [Halomicroarcula marina]
MGGSSHVEYVGASSVRSDVVCTLCDRTRRTDELLSALDASESAVYDALSDLETRGVIVETPDGWRLSGIGRLVADTLARQHATDALLAAEPEYWESHDASVVPEPFRCRLPELGEYEVLRAAERDLRGLVPWVVEKVEAVESCDIVSPVYHREYQEAMPDNEDSRLLVSEPVVDDVLLTMEDGPYTRVYEETDVRVTTVSFALGVSERWTILTVPTYDGRWPSAKVYAESASAVEWGRDLFEHVWTASTPLETYLERQ